MTAHASLRISATCEALVIFAASCLQSDSDHVARTVDVEEAASLLQCIEIVDGWLERFAVNLESVRARRKHKPDKSLQEVRQPRNKPAFVRSQATRAQIENLLRCHDPLAPPLTAKQIRPILGRELSERQIRRHLQAIRSRL